MVVALLVKTGSEAETQIWLPVSMLTLEVILANSQFIHLYEDLAEFLTNRIRKYYKMIDFLHDTV